MSDALKTKYELALPDRKVVVLIVIGTAADIGSSLCKRYGDLVSMKDRIPPLHHSPTVPVLATLQNISSLPCAVQWLGYEDSGYFKL
jgi:hypothetical protein